MVVVVVVVDCWLMVVGCWLSVVACWLLCFLVAELVWLWLLWFLIVG